MTVFGLDGIPPYTSHGHPSGSTIPAGTPRPENVARCGGPRLCKQCKREAGLEHEPAAADCIIAQSGDIVSSGLRCYVCDPGRDPAPCNRAPAGYQCTRGWHPAGTSCQTVRVLRDLNLYEVSLIAHPPVNGCVELSEHRPSCPNCGAGYAKIGNLENVAFGAGIRVDAVPTTEGPTKDAHSRACGIREHKHGTACSPDCPTCGGRAEAPSFAPPNPGQPTSHGQPRPEPDEELALDVPVALLQDLDSWLSALKHGRVVTRAYATMSEDDRMELDTLLRRVQAWTRARG